MEDILPVKVFNLNKTDYSEKKPLFLGQEPGMFDTINRHYPEIWSIYELQKSLDWSASEFDYSASIQEFETCDKSVYEMMVRNLSYQWEADSVAARAIAPVLAPFISSSELWAAWQRISDNEVIHATTYSEIVRNSFKDPTVVMDEILKIKQMQSRLGKVAKAFEDGYIASHKYALGLLSNSDDVYDVIFRMLTALYCMERIQFMSSFAVTFGICDTGMFQQIGKSIQKICQDEYEVHSLLDQTVIKIELSTERGKASFERNKEAIKQIIDEVVLAEIETCDYLFSEGRQLSGITADRLKQWCIWCSKDVYDVYGFKCDIAKMPKVNPLKYMDKWINISAIQASPQEEPIAAYRVNILKRNDDGEIFDVDF